MSVPMDPTITIVQNELQDPLLPHRTSMSIPEIITLLEFCLKTPSPSSKVSILNRSIGSPIYPLIANLFMEKFKVKAISFAPTHPNLWLRYIDDTYVIKQAEHSHQLLQHINSQDTHIQFIVEDPNEDGILPSWIPLFPWDPVTP